MQKTKQKNIKFYSIILICLLGLIIYSNSYKCTFHFDDFHSFIDNSKVHDLNNLKAIWNY